MPDDWCVTNSRTWHQACWGYEAAGALSRGAFSVGHICGVWKKLRNKAFNLEWQVRGAAISWMQDANAPVCRCERTGFVYSFVKAKESGALCGQAAGSVETPLTWPASVVASHDQVCTSEWRVPSGQLWPSGRLTVMVQ